MRSINETLQMAQGMVRKMEEMIEDAIRDKSQTSPEDDETQYIGIGTGDIGMMSVRKL